MYIKETVDDGLGTPSLAILLISLTTKIASALVLAQARTI
jgi:hypothetical protein